MRERIWYEKNRWRLSKGKPETVNCLLEELEDTQWSKEFEKLMRNRLILGALRYGKIHATGKPMYDRTAAIQKRLDLYYVKGNKEYLVDIANLCLLEFEECHHPFANFTPVDDGEHVKIIQP